MPLKWWHSLVWSSSCSILYDIRIWKKFIWDISVIVNYFFTCRGEGKIALDVHLKWMWLFKQHSWLNYCPILSWAVVVAFLWLSLRAPFWSVGHHGVMLPDTAGCIGVCGISAPLSLGMSAWFDRPNKGLMYIRKRAKSLAVVCVPLSQHPYPGLGATPTYHSYW